MFSLLPASLSRWPQCLLAIASARALFRVIGFLVFTLVIADHAVAQSQCNQFGSEVWCGTRTECTWIPEVYQDGVLKRKAYCRSRPRAAVAPQVPVPQPAQRPMLVLTHIPLLGVSVDDALVIRRIDDPTTGFKDFDLALNPRITVMGAEPRTAAELNDFVEAAHRKGRDYIPLIFKSYPQPGSLSTMAFQFRQPSRVSAATAGRWVPLSVSAMHLIVAVLGSMFCTLGFVAAIVAYRKGSLAACMPGVFMTARRHEPRTAKGFSPWARERAAAFRLPTVDGVRTWLAHKIGPAMPRQEPHFGPPSVPVPVLSPGPPVLPPAFLRDTPTAQRALRLARSFMDDAESAGGDEDAYPQARATLALAAKQLEIAAKVDPDATLVIDDEGLAIRQPFLRACLLTQEAMIAETSAKAIQFAEQATRSDPTYDPAFFALGLRHLNLRHKPEAISAFKAALALDQENIEYQKYLMRAEAITASEIVTYHASKFTTNTIETGIVVWKWAKVLGTFAMIGLMILPFYFLSSCMRADEIARGRSGDNTPGAFSLLLAFILLGVAFRSWARIKQWFSAL